MGSALAMWAYHRRLSLEAQNRISTPPDADPQLMEKAEQRNRSRSYSESSSVPPEERRESIEVTEEDSDDEGHEKKPQSESQPHHKHRRFSLDFLFGKKGKNKKAKQKRANSITVQETEAEYRAHRYPGIDNNDFSFFYFI